MSNPLTWVDLEAAEPARRARYIDLVYVAGPYSAPTPAERAANIEAAWTVGYQVASLGAYPVVPHMNTAHMDDLQDWQWWIDATLELMLRCNAVLMMEGWEASRGARGEEAAAKRFEIPVFYKIEDLADWIAEQKRLEGV